MRGVRAIWLAIVGGGGLVRRALVLACVAAVVGTAPAAADGDGREPAPGEGSPQQQRESSPAVKDEGDGSDENGRRERRAPDPDTRESAPDPDAKESAPDPDAKESAPDPDAKESSRRPHESDEQRPGSGRPAPEPPPRRKVADACIPPLGTACFRQGRRYRVRRAPASRRHRAARSRRGSSSRPSARP